MPDKQSDIRRRKRHERAALSATAKLTADQSIVSHILDWPLYHACQRLAVYQTVPEEACVMGILPDAYAADKSCYLPIVPDATDGCLSFARVTEQMQLQANRYGILEPIPPHEDLDVAGIDLLFMPLVAFDKAGNRVGMGAGYYDRTLAPVADKPMPIRVGVAYGIQEVPEIVPNAWDVPCQYLVTEHGMIPCVE